MPEFITREEFQLRAMGKSEHFLPPELLAGQATEQIIGMMPGIRKFGSFEVVEKEIDPDTGMTDVTFVISTEALDRDDDVISLDGWELENYKKNPVVLWAHDYSKLPVAKSVGLSISDGKLLSIDRFTPQEINPLGHMVYQMVKGGFLRATSVGFKPLEYVFNDEHKGYDFSKQEMMEHSIVPVPSNPEALVAASAKGIDLTPMREWAEKILDRDPDSDKVALWLPKNAVELIHRSLTDVAVSLSGTSTSKDPAVDASADSADASEYIINEEQEEVIMEKAIEALTEAVKTLSAQLVEMKASADANAEATKALSAQIEEMEKAPEGTKEPDDEITEEDITAIAKATAEATILATTGQLPE